MSRVVDLLLLLVVILFRACLPCTVEIHDGWRACRVPADPSQGCGDDESVLMMVSRLPVTALTVLLGNRQIAGAEHLTLDDLYYSTNLALLPDIHRVGREYYTLLYQIDIAAMNDTTSYCLGGDDDDKISLTRQTIRFAGINYRARTWLDGHPLVELEQPDGRDVPGMFVRRIYDVTDGGRFNLLIAPPDHPGIPDPGQGGNHDLAQDGAVPQFMLGWDWCQAMPDRATGFHGSTILERSGLWTVQDPAIQTVQLLNCTSLLANHHQCSSVVLQILARVEGGGGPAHDDSPATAPAVSTLTVTSDWGEIWRIPIASPTRDVCVPVTVQHPEQIKLWWPAGVGMENFAHRHTFTFSLAVNGKVSNVKTIQAGIRTIETFLDEKIQGQLFRINSQDVYLVGGNFIATDQALRYSASEARYCAEISLHRHAGLNLLRVWGGGTAQPDQFYDCADRLGVLVFQEFWMTGDNNGRWAGNYSWPLDYSAYLANVEDTVKRLRRHPSLLFYGGCNECLAPRSSTWAPNPPNQIDDGIRKVIDQYDPGRFYIASSMGGPNKADPFFDPTLYNNRTYSLAFADGPYGMLLPSTYFDRNPGLPFKDISIGFQPEIGSVGIPTWGGLLKFMNLQDIETGFPRRNKSATNNTSWNFHKFLPWSTQLLNNDTYDHVYAYFNSDHSVNARDWTAAAQLAAHSQYQNLCNGFISHLFNYTTAVVIWKTQSPWPSLRGFLYDWYLESTGTLRGMRAALGSPVSIAFDPKLWRLRVINRQLFPVTRCADAPIGATYTWIDLHGATVATGEAVLSAKTIAAMSTHLLKENTNLLKWPKGCTDVCLLLLKSTGDCRAKQDFASWHWLTDPALGDAGDYSQLGELRKRQAGNATVELRNCIVSKDGLRLDLRLGIGLSVPDVLFYPTFSIHRLIDGSQLLPVIDSRETDVVLTPGIIQLRRLETSATVEHGERILVVLKSWNAPEIYQYTVCTRSEVPPPPDVKLATTVRQE